MSTPRKELQLLQIDDKRTNLGIDIDVRGQREALLSSAMKENQRKMAAQKGGSFIASSRQGSTQQNDSARNINSNRGANAGSGLQIQPNTNQTSQGHQETVLHMLTRVDESEQIGGDVVKQLRQQVLEEASQRIKLEEYVTVVQRYLLLGGHHDADVEAFKAQHDESEKNYDNTALTDMMRFCPVVFSQNELILSLNQEV